jgi:hypothetical protein
MSGERADLTGKGEGRPWALWRRQVAAILRLETRKILLGRRTIVVYLLAMLPLFLISLFHLVLLIEGDAEVGSPSQLPLVFAGIYQFILRFVVYVGCVWIFINLFRGEILDGSLHYYFLCPVRREVLAVGKYLAGLTAAVVLFGGSTLLSWVYLYARVGPAAALEQIFGRGEAGGLLTYLGITLLACIGYGALFLVIGLYLRNPVIPAVLLWGWEWLNPVLPGLLKKISVIHYLQSMRPVQVSDEAVALLGQPTPPWISVPGILILTAGLLFLAGLATRQLEISYGAD